MIIYLLFNKNMGNDDIKYSISNSYIIYVLKLEKTCYLPGENINGIILLAGKPGLKETLLTTPKSIFIIHQQQFYKNDENVKHKTDKIFEKHLNFNNFVGSNLLLKIKIPFSIKLPYSIIPSFSLRGGHYTNHFFSCEFPSLKVKKVLRIVVKNNPYFTKANKLYREPCKIVEVKSKSDFLIKKGNYKMSIVLPKNSFYYDEEIPYEITVECEKLDLNLEKLEISLQRVYAKKFAFPIENKDKFILKYIKFNNKNKIHNFKGFAYFPKNEHYLPKIYDLIDKNGPYDGTFDAFEKKYYFAPCLRADFIAIEYKLKFKIYINGFTFDDNFYIPIDFYSRPAIKKDNEIKQSISHVTCEDKYKMIDKPQEKDLTQNKNITLNEKEKNGVKNNFVEEKDKKDNSEILAAAPLPLLNKENINQDNNNICNNINIK